MSRIGAFSWPVVALLTACNAPERGAASRRGESPPATAASGAQSAAKNPPAGAPAAGPGPGVTGEPEGGTIALELRLSIQGSPDVRAHAPIPLVLELVNRSRSVPYWLGGWSHAPTVGVSAQWDDAGRWVDVAPTPMDGFCGKEPFSWTTPVDPIQPGEAWTFEEEFAVTTARCAGQPTKFVGFEFPGPGRARIAARYVHPGQLPGKSGFGAPRLPPFELVSKPLQVRVLP